MFKAQKQKVLVDLTTVGPVLTIAGLDLAFIGPDLAFTGPDLAHMGRTRPSSRKTG